MCEGMAYLNTRVMPLGHDRRRGLRRFDPFAAGPAEHTAKKASVRAALQQPGPIHPTAYVSDAVTCGFGRLWKPARKPQMHSSFARSTARHPRTDSTGGRSGCADRGSKIHHRLRIIAGPAPWCQAAGKPLQFRLGFRQRGIDEKDPGHDLSLPHT